MSDWKPCAACTAPEKCFNSGCLYAGPLPLPPLGGMQDALAEAERQRRARAAAEDQFSDKMWRLTNLYYIIDENGREVHFKPRPMQLKFLEDMWYLNCILKARQHGFTTLITLWILDECVFYPNQNAGIVAHNLDDGSKIFRTKIKHPYERLPEQILAANPATNDRSQELVFANLSQISVSTSTRSGTCQYVLITEFGKIAAKFPEKADEIVTGTFNTVHPGNYLFVESTAEGRFGHFHDLCKRSRDAQRMRRPLTRLDFKFHFYPWWANDEYQLPTEEAKQVPLLRSHIEYFQKLERTLAAALEAGEPWARDWARIGPRFSLERMAWYIKKRELNGADLIKREYPSTPDEAFEASVKGAYFAEQMAEAREKGRVGKVPHAKGISVITWWDLGIRDKTAIWFLQVVGREARFINYFEATDRSMTWFLTTKLPEMAKEHGYHYGPPVGPHDLTVREFTTGVTRWETAKSLGWRFHIAPQMDFEDQLEAARNFIGSAWFDEAYCEKGLEHLENFRKEWNEHIGQYMEKPLHDEHSHGASAFMTGSIMFNQVNSGRARAHQVGQRSFPT